MTARLKLQSLVYDILPPTTSITDYAIGLEKLSANEQIFVGGDGAQMQNCEAVQTPILL